MCGLRDGSHGGTFLAFLPWRELVGPRICSSCCGAVWPLPLYLGLCHQVCGEGGGPLGRIT